MRILLLALIFSGIFLPSYAQEPPPQTAVHASSNPTVPANFSPEKEHAMVTRLVARILSSAHYQSARLDNDFSAKVYDLFIKDIDYNRYYFLEEDVKEFAKDREQVDDHLQSGNVQFAFTLYNRFLLRIDERIRYTYRLLDGDSLDFTVQDSFQVKREKAAWCKDAIALDKLWFQKIKYELVGMKAAGKSWKEASDIIRKRYENLEKSLYKTQSEDIYSYFMNSVSEVVDPHTNYFSPKQGDDFKITTSQALEGIGATLGVENDYTKIRDLVKGGPAERSKKVKVGDLIVSVGQSKSGEMIDVVGWRIDDVVSKIRGPKGSIVRLGIISDGEPLNSIPHIVILERDKIKLEDQTAKGSIQEVMRDKKKYKMGIITLPSFYYDYAGAQKGEKDFSSTTRDVGKLLDGFKKQGVKGVVLDLRNNGGGSLLEAINLTGLFINHGPVVQVKDASGAVRIEQDHDPSIAWTGPLIVLVNRFSASASEIFAGAIQDYERGLIVGENTFGKGTVQNIADLEVHLEESEKQYLRTNNKRVGQLKLTIAKFYRVNGSSTQLKGVSPDIDFPGIYSDKEYGEEANPYALAWDQIATSKYEPVGMVSSQIKLMLISSHEQRMKQNEEYKYLLDDVVNYRAYRLKEYATINVNELKKEQKAQNEKNKTREEVRKKLLSGSKDQKYDLVMKEGQQILVDYIQLAGK